MDGMPASSAEKNTWSRAYDGLTVTLEEISSSHEQSSGDDDAATSQKMRRTATVRTAPADSRKAQAGVTAEKTEDKSGSHGRSGSQRSPGRKNAGTTLSGGRDPARDSFWRKTSGPGAALSNATSGPSVKDEERRSLLGSEDAQASDHVDSVKQHAPRRKSSAKPATAPLAGRATTTLATEAPPALASTAATSKRSSTAPRYRPPGTDDDSIPEKARASRSDAVKRRQHFYAVKSIEPDQASIKAIRQAQGIPGLASRDRPGAFSSVLEKARTMPPDSRCAVLVHLGQAVSLFDEDLQATYVNALRSLAEPAMHSRDRKKVYAAILRSFVQGESVPMDGNDRDQALSSSGATRSAQETEHQELSEYQVEIKVLVEQLGRFHQGRGSKTFEGIEKILTEIAGLREPLFSLSCVALFIDALDTYHVSDRGQVVELLFKVFGERMVFCALFKSRYLDQIAACIADPLYSSAALLKGFLERDGNCVLALKTVLRRLSSVEKFFQSFLAVLENIPDKPGNIRSIASLKKLLLMDIAVLSDMPQRAQCVLVGQLLCCAESEELQLKLHDARMEADETGTQLAHRLIASTFSVPACSSLLEHAEDDDAPDLEHYRQRVDAATGKAVAPSGGSSRKLRALLAEGKDPDLITAVVWQVLASRQEFHSKFKLIEGCIDPLTNNLFEYIDTEYLKATRDYLGDISQGKLNSLLRFRRIVAAVDRHVAKNLFRAADLGVSGNTKAVSSGAAAQTAEKEEKAYFETLYVARRQLSSGKLHELKAVVQEKKGEALSSMLPSLHVAIQNDRVEAVDAYLKAVLNAPVTLKTEELMRLLKMESHGTTAFYRALVHGSPKMITTFMKAILGSTLSDPDKLDLLHARRKKDELAAFYVAMSGRDENRVIAFVSEVLASSLPSLYKEKLLKSKKPLSGKAARDANDVKDASPAVQDARVTARAQALKTEQEWKERAAHHSTYGAFAYDLHVALIGPRDRKARPSLVSVFDQLIGNSALSASQKSTLTNELAASQ